MNKRFLQWLVLCLISVIPCFASPPKASPTPPALNATNAILIDTTTGKVLYEKEADQKMPPSSMCKIMTAYLVFDELKAGRLKMDQTFPISEKAWRKKGSKMFVNIRDQVCIEDLLRGVLIQSGNDASIALAEGIAGSEEAFAEQMTRVAHEMGAVRSTFTNATGWPDEEPISTARDLALIAQKTIDRFPEYYPMYGEKEFTYNNITQSNRNPLLGHMPGADGLKTGYTEDGGYGLVASAMQDGRRLIMVINGCESKKTRARDADTLMKWGFMAYVSPRLFGSSEPVDALDVWQGERPRVGMVVDKDIYVTLPRQEMRDLKVQVMYKTPISAPLKKGQRVGTLLISSPSIPEFEAPLLAAETVERTGFFSRIKSSVSYLFVGHH